MVQRQNHRQMPAPVRRASVFLMAGVLSLFAGACAHYEAGTPALQWQLNTADADSADQPASASADAAPSACGQGDQSGWSDHCYVHREGRDLTMGASYTRL